MNAASPSDALAIATGGLDTDSARSLKTTFADFLAQAEQWGAKAAEIHVTDRSEVRLMKLARESRLALREIRINVENTRKRLKEEGLRKGKAIDAAANILKGLLEPLEAHLLTQETFAERADAADRQRAIAIQAEAEREERARADRERAAREAELRAENERLRREAAEREAVRVERERGHAAPGPSASTSPAGAPQEPALFSVATQLTTPEPANALLIPPRRLTQRGETGFLGITASAIDRSMECPSWVVFPRVYRTSEYADRGHRIHAYIRAILSGTPRDAALAAVPLEYAETCRMLDWNKLCGDLENLETEAAYAINVVTRTARFLGFNIGRKYHEAASRTGQPLTDDDVCGSLDVAGTKNGRPTIRDLKSGFQDVAGAGKNGQVMFFAAVKMLLTGAPEVDSEIAKLKPNGDLWMDRATFTAIDVDTFLDELESTVERAKKARRLYLAGGMPDVSEGDGCRFCSASDSCPAKTAFARAMLGELGAIDGAVDGLSLEATGRVFEIAHDQAKPIIDRVIASCKERGTREDVPLSKGKKLGALAYERNDLNRDAVVALARTLGATDDQIRGCYRTATVTQVRVLNAEGLSKKKRRAVG